MNINDYILNHTTQAYCEAIILPNGDVEDAVPSHTNKLVEISGKTFEEVCELMPVNAGPVPWLVDYTNCVSVWYEFGMLPEDITDKQKESIKKLIDHGVLDRNFHAEKYHELKVCGINEISKETKTSSPKIGAIGNPIPRINFSEEIDL